MGYKWALIFFAVGILVVAFGVSEEIDGFVLRFPPQTQKWVERAVVLTGILFVIAGGIVFTLRALG